MTKITANISNVMSDEPERRLAEAQIALKNGDAAAAHMYRTLLADYPGFLPGWLSAAVAFHNLSLDQEALSVVERIPLNQDNPALTDFVDLMKQRIGNASGTAVQQQRRTGAISPHISQDEAQPAVHIYTVTFFDFSGSKVFPGGAERYIFDLADLLKSLGLKTRIYQAGNSEWRRWVHGIEVIAIPWLNSIYSLSRDFATTEQGVLNIYSPFSLGVADLHGKNVGICHGMYWDHEGSTLLNDDVARDVFSSIKHLENCVSVDATSINVIRGTRPDLARKISYIPNYVSNTFFDNDVKDGDQLTILYPRRLYGPRGYWLLAEIVPQLIARFSNVNILFLGDSDAREREHCENLVKQYPGRVLHKVAFPEEMHYYYATSDITVVPTTHSEGTSLSALEALASGNAVISTDVGGLSNIIIDELNGLLIPPNSEHLFDAICRLVEDSALRRRLRKTGRESARAFSLNKWRSSWEKIVKAKVQISETLGAEMAILEPAIRIVHLLAGGISWGSGPGLPKQRPHHLMKAISELGTPVTFVSDEMRTSPESSSTGCLEVLGRDSLVYADKAILYTYYAYHALCLGEPAEQWIKELSEEEARPFRLAHQNHAIKTKLVWFDLIDDPSLHDSSTYSRAVELFIKHADFVSTSSKILHERYRSVRSDLILIENACWPAHFAGTATDRAIDLASIEKASRLNRPIVGYIGAVAPWFDFNLLQKLARRMPDVEFVIAGPVAPDVKADVRKLELYKNVNFIGSVPYESVPNILASIDVAILPFVKNNVTDVTNPLKVFEYLAAGLPVVGTDLDELQAIKKADGPSFLKVARDDRQFAEFLEAAVGLRVSNGTQFGEGVAEAKDYARGQTWYHRAAFAIQSVPVLSATATSAIAPSEWTALAHAADGAELPLVWTGSTGARVQPLEESSGATIELRVPILIARPKVHRIEFLVAPEGGSGRSPTDLKIELDGDIIWQGQIITDASVLITTSLPAGLSYLSISMIDTASTDFRRQLGFEIDNLAVAECPPGVAKICTVRQADGAFKCGRS